MVRFFLAALLLTLGGVGCVSSQPAVVDSVNAPLPVDARVQRDPQTGAVLQLRARSLGANLPDLPATLGAGDLALRVIAAYREVFQLADPVRELRVVKVQSDELGYTHVTLQQIFAGLPVWGAELKVHSNGVHEVYLINGRYWPTALLPQPRPELSAAQAEQRALTAIGLSAPCPACRSELLIYPQQTAARLAYRVRVEAGPAQSWQVFVDAQTGAVLDTITNIQTRLPPVRIQ